MRIWPVVVVAALAVAVPLLSQTPPAQVEITGHVVEPARLQAASVDGLRVPEGFSISRFEENLGHPRMLADADDGSVYVTRREEGDVLEKEELNRLGHGKPYGWPSAVLMSAPTIHLAQPPGGDHRLAIQRLGEPAARLEVTSPAFNNGQSIPLVHSDYDQKVSPALSWGGAPPKVASFVVIMEDPDATAPKPFVHWLVYDIPPFVLTIEEARSGVPKLLSPEGALQGRTSRGSIGYLGPRPPIADPPHHYHVQVFALDTMLRLEPGADREGLLEAMRGHVLAAGELVGTFKAPPDAK